jgi:hypothetical protein
MTRGRLLLSIGAPTAWLTLSPFAQTAAPAPGTRFVDLDSRGVRVQALGLDTRGPASLS